VAVDRRRRCGHGEDDGGGGRPSAGRDGLDGRRVASMTRGTTSSASRSRSRRRIADSTRHGLYRIKTIYKRYITDSTAAPLGGRPGPVRPRRLGNHPAARPQNLLRIFISPNHGSSSMRYSKHNKQQNRQTKKRKKTQPHFHVEVRKFILKFSYSFSPQIA